MSLEYLHDKFGKENDEFFKIWRNIYLNCLILNENRNVNIHSGKMDFDLESLKNYSNPEYLTNIQIEGIENEEDLRNLSTIVPNSVKTLSFQDDFNLQLKKGDLPNQITSLTFGKYYNQPIGVGVLHQGLEKLIFGRDYNHAFQVGVLPSTLKFISMSEDFNHPIGGPGVLPQSLETLVFNFAFDQVIEIGELPNGLLNLELGTLFNQELTVGVLPDSLINLSIYNNYNHPILPGVLPHSLKSFDCAQLFNQAFQIGSLPQSLESIRFRAVFNKSFEIGVLPSNLKSLHFGNHFNQKLLELPDKLETLIFSNGFNNELPNELPKTLTKLVFALEHNKPITQILPELTHLELGRMYSHPIDFVNQFPKLSFLKIESKIPGLNQLPNGIKELHIVGPFLEPLPIGFINQDCTKIRHTIPSIPLVDSLPSSLTFLHVDQYDDLQLPVGIFKSCPLLKTLVLAGDCQELPIDLPDSLESLQLSNSFNSVIPIDILPKSLKSLNFGYSFSTELIPGSLPPSLTSITFGECHEETLKVSQLENLVNLKSIAVGKKTKFEQNCFPQSLKQLHSYNTNQKDLYNLSDIKISKIEF